MSIYVFGAGVAHLDIALRDCYARSRQSLTSMMETFSKCGSALGSHSPTFAGVKRHHDVYTALAAAGSRFLERGLGASTKSTCPREQLPDYQFISNTYICAMLKDVYAALGAANG